MRVLIRTYIISIHFLKVLEIHVVDWFTPNLHVYAISWSPMFNLNFINHLLEVRKGAPVDKC